MIVWDPIKQYPTLSRHLLEVCYETGCGHPLSFWCWQDGRKSRYNPRCLYGVDGTTVLICQIFRCRSNHFITGCDPRVLNTFSQQISLPFVLLHRTGVTLQAYTTIFDMVCQGTSFSDIESFFLWRCQEKHSSTRLTLHKLGMCFEEVACPKQYISNDLIMELFITMFNKMKIFLQESMYSITAECLSCDHTFKLPKHIGLKRGNDWVPQYDSMFIIQSDKGEILFWQLTVGSAYNAVCDGLKSLNQRITDAQNKVKMVIIDNCCTWKRKLMDTFGEHVKIKLDIFHAMKRVSTVLSKKHPHFYNCVQDLRLVFRSKGDNGPVRSMPTPSPTILLANTQCFIEKWGAVTSEEKGNILSPAAVKEFAKLKKHMEKGCLSEIPPKFGTNRNENLHRSINHRLAGHRLGVELAVALLSVFFHSWNMKRRGCSQSIYTSYLESSVSSTGLHQFGIGVSSEKLHCEQQLGTAFNGYSSCNTAEAIETINALRGTLPSCESSATLDILQRALTSSVLEDFLSTISDTVPKSARISMQMTSHIKEQALTEDKQAWTEYDEEEDPFTDDEQVHTKRLANVLHSYNIDVIDVPRDGDCLFASIATSILLQYQTMSAKILEHMQSISIDVKMSRSEVAKQLRQLLVQEWLTYHSEYRKFFEGAPEFDYETEVQKYLKPGVFSSTLGDAMLFGLSSVLRLPLVVFTSIESWPCMTIHPRSIPLDPMPILLAYLQAGPGHYSLAVRKTDHHVQSTDPSASPQNESTKCRCGRGRNASNKQKPRCSTSSQYASRCPCLRSSKGCVAQCECQGCDNPFGKNSTSQASQQARSRKKRPRYEEQQLARSTSSVKYMKICGEQPISGRWTTIEHYVLLAIIYNVCDKNTMNFDKIDTISDTYREILDFVIKHNIPVSLAGKSSVQIKAKMQQNLKEDQVSKECKTINILPV